MATHFDNVAIIGGGLLGLCLAISLQQRGIHSTIYESRSEGSWKSGSMILNPNSLRALDQLGVYQTLLGRGAQQNVADIVTTQGAHVEAIVLGSKEQYGYDGMRILRGEVREALLAEALKLGIKIQYGKRFLEVSAEDENKASVRFEDGSEVQADLVVGANGINSSLRKYVAPSSSDPVYSGILSIFAEKAETVAGGDEIVKDGAVKFIVAPGGAFAITPSTGGGGISFFATLPVPDRSQEEWKELNLNKEALKSLLVGRYLNDAWPESVRNLVKNTPKEEYFLTAFRHVSELENWTSTKGRVVIAGDTAHAIPPSAGQGGNIAIEDAVTLGITIGEINRQGQDKTQELFRKWDQHRIERIRQVILRNEIATKIRNGVSRAQAEKEAGGQLDNSNVGLQWLYNYDTKDLEKTLREGVVA